MENISEQLTAVLSGSAAWFESFAKERKGIRLREVQRISMSCRLEGALQLCNEDWQQEPASCTRGRMTPVQSVSPANHSSRVYLHSYVCYLTLVKITSRKWMPLISLGCVDMHANLSSIGVAPFWECSCARPQKRDIVSGSCHKLLTMAECRGEGSHDQG